MSQDRLADEKTYEAHAFVQRWAARELIGFLGAVEPRSIFEAGCGTGIYTRMLAERFPKAAIRAVDLRPAVKPFAREAASGSVEVVVGDAESAAGGPYDLVTSNAAFHWFKRPEATLGRHGAMLSNGGLLAFSCFGPETYRELDTALVAALGGGVRTVASRFGDAGEVGKLVRAIFADGAIEERRREDRFDSLAELLLCIKRTRTNNRPGGGVFWTRGKLARVERAYLDRYGAITATYQVFLCRGRR